MGNNFHLVDLPLDLRSATIYNTGRYMMNYRKKKIVLLVEYLLLRADGR